MPQLLQFHPNDRITSIHFFKIHLKNEGKFLNGEIKKLFWKQMKI